MRSGSDAAELDAVTIDAFGTLLELVDPAPALAGALRERGLERDPESIARAFTAEVAYYIPRSHEGRDAESLAALRRECASVFLAELGVELEPGEFAPAFVGALEFRVADGALSALDALRSAGFVLACVANWDVSLGERLGAAGLADRFVELALARLGTKPARTVHVGDGEADREGARAAGLAFEPVPLATLPERLGLE
ncbi:MAG: hypothetical protein E6G67_07095 [Actinobacteria bacterium]|nr:MAG: hypothetical protein E6G67_07095 [Actinomycetota bacterium]